MKATGDKDRRLRSLEEGGEIWNTKPTKGRENRERRSRWKAGDRRPRWKAPTLKETKKRSLAHAEERGVYDGICDVGGPASEGRRVLGNARLKKWKPTVSRLHTQSVLSRFAPIEPAVSQAPAL